MPGALAEARAVDPALRMLDPHADREGLGLDMHAAPVEHLEGRPGAVPHREHDMIGLEKAAVMQVQPAHPLVPVRHALELEIVDSRLPAIFAAQRLDRRPHALDHGDEAEGADMRMRFPQYVVGRAGLDELLQHLAAQEARVLHPAIELAVGKGAGAAFAELHIAVRVQFGAAPQAPGILGALAHHLAAIEDDGPEAHLRQDQPGEQAARSRADHHGAQAAPAARRRHREAVCHVRGGAQVLVVREAREHRRFVGQLDIDGIDQLDRIASAGVVAAAIEAVALELGGLDAQPPGDRLGQGLGCMVERQIQSGQAKHPGPLAGNAARLKSPPSIAAGQTGQSRVFSQA